MANEGTFTFALTIAKQPPMSADQVFNIFNQIFNVSSGKYIRDVITVSHTAETQIPMGQVVSAGYFAWYNADSVNYIKIRTGTGGTYFARTPAGHAGVFELEPTLLPYAIADTGDCDMEYAIYSR